MSSSRPRDGRALEAPITADEARPTPPHRPHKSGSHPRIARRPLQDVVVLVVDDHDDTRAMLAEYLAWHGAVALEASSVAAAIGILERAEVQVVLTDVAMPYEDGYALLARMDEHPEWRRIPRVVASGHSSITEAAERAPRAEYLKKPVDLDLLTEVITRAVADGE